ncbi:MAG: SDR family oxidoreductase [Proteobacteria bacterium]|nr:SDR family oxidoreductase [Pseudomonadota bacterium]
MSRGVAIVTGGGRGIGAATARLAAARGYAVAIFYRSGKAAADGVVAAIERADGRAIAVQVDVGREDDVLRGLRAADALGPLTLLVNNAGIVGPIGRLDTLDAAGLYDVLRTNVAGAFLCAREAVKRMSTAHGGQGGSIVNVSSGAAENGSPGVYVHYAASKAALDAMTIGLAREVAREGIRVNAVRPGLIDTDIHVGRPPGQLDTLLAQTPMGRIGTPDEIAAAILWLASDEAGFVTAALLDARGGKY